MQKQKRGLVASFSRRNIDTLKSEHENTNTNIFDSVEDVDADPNPNPTPSNTVANSKIDREIELIMCRGAAVSTNTAALGGDYHAIPSSSSKAPVNVGGIVLKTKTSECTVEWVEEVNALMQHLERLKPV